MSIPDADDRREYYRIEDCLALEFQPLETPDGVAPHDDSAADDSPLFDLLGDLHVLEFESQHLLRQIADRDRALASYLKVIDKRIDLIARALAGKILTQAPPARPVTLSEGGLTFHTDAPIDVGQLLALKLILPPGIGLRLHARVSHCDSRPEGGHTIGTLFEGMEEAQRQLLARHILQRQAAERRQRKADNP